MRIGTMISGLAVALLAASTVAAADVAVHGTVSQGWLKSSEYDYLTPDTKDGTFSFNEMILNTSARVDGNLRIGLQLLGRDFGPEGNNEVLLDWAFGDYRWRDALGFRVGKVKTPIGLYNKTRDIDMVRTPVLMPQSVYTEEFRTVATAFQGASIYGNLPVGGSSSVDYEAFYGNIELNSTDFLAYLLQRAMGGTPMLSYEAECEYVVGGALIWNTPLEGLRVGASLLSMEMNTRANFTGLVPADAPPGTPPGVLPLDLFLDMKSVYVLSAEYVRDALTLAAEYQRFEVDMEITTPMGTMLDDDRRGGYYLQGAYRVSPLLEFGTYYSVYHPDWRDRDGEDMATDFAAWQKDLALTARFDVTDNWLLKLEAHFMNGAGDVDPAANPDGFDEESWTMLAAKSTFYF